MNIPTPDRRLLLAAGILLVVTLTTAFGGRQEQPRERPERFHSFLSEPIRRLSESTRRSYVEIEDVAEMLNELEDRGHTIHEILTVSEGYPNSSGTVGGAVVPRVLVITRR